MSRRSWSPARSCRRWPVEGTTGYDAMREVNGVFVDPAAAPYLTDLYRRLTGDERSIADHVEAGKRMVDDELLPAEVRRMARLVPEVPGAARRIAEAAVAFDVYRSYLPAEAEHLDAALAAGRAAPARLARDPRRAEPAAARPDRRLARRMQQLSGATMAKGVEDTAYYRYARFVALNEVGGDPASWHPAGGVPRLQAGARSGQPRR